MAPTQFSDLGAKANDLFSDHHDAGNLFLSRKGKIGNDANYEMRFDNSVGGDNVDWKFTAELAGCTVSFDHENNLSKEIDIGVPKMPELSLKWSPMFNPATGLSLGNLAANYVHEKANLNCTLPINKDPTVDLDLTLQSGKCPNVLGFKGSLDTKGAFTNGQFAWQCAKDDFEASFVSDGITSVAGTSSFFKCLPNNKNFCCYGVQTTSAGQISVAAATACNGGNSYRFKMNQAGELSVAKVHKLNGQATLNLSAAVNMTSMSAGGHKFGMGFSFQ